MMHEIDYNMSLADLQNCDDDELYHVFKSLSIQCKVETLVQVKNDLESRLEELI